MDVEQLEDAGDVRGGVDLDVRSMVAVGAVSRMRVRKSWVGFQPRTFLALAGLPTSIVGSAGRTAAWKLKAGWTTSWKRATKCAACGPEK